MAAERVPPKDMLMPGLVAELKLNGQKGLGGPKSKLVARVADGRARGALGACPRRCGGMLRKGGIAGSRYAEEPDKYWCPGTGGAGGAVPCDFVTHDEPRRNPWVWLTP
mmetsp:Transcript_6505/g.23165  ORF Transcript_6505/g.23165 Transcript_6505/m.23165 type:complete len:109 (-) Transcript_6505:204-530(-)